jgi:hypothetical protein
MSWQPEIDALREREALARRMGGADKVKRQHDAGKLTVRGGAADAVIWWKQVIGEQFAHEMRLPASEAAEPRIGRSRIVGP